MSKSMWALHRFIEWYAEGNRMPDDVSVMAYDIEGLFANIDELSNDEIVQKGNLIWFMITYCGGYPHAVIVPKVTLTDS